MLAFARKTLAIASLTALACAPVAANASGLMNVISSQTTTLSGTLHTTDKAWTEYCGIQLTLSETSDTNSQVGLNLSGLDAKNGIAGNANLYAQKGQNFAASLQLTFFKGGDHSTSDFRGHMEQVQTVTSNGIQTSFGN
jgi:invasion protein IalB